MTRRGIHWGVNRYNVAVVVIVCAAIAGVVTLTSRYGPSDMRKAEAPDILSILSEQPDTIIRMLDLDEVDLSLPTDGLGARLLVRVQPGQAATLPKSIVVEHQGALFEVAIEVSETYEKYQAQ